MTTTNDTAVFDTAKIDRRETATADDRRPYRLHLGRDRHVHFGAREAGLAAAALGLGYAAYRGVSALLSSASRTTVRPSPEPFAAAPAPEIKDNAAPRFVGEQPGSTDAVPFVAASDDDDTGNLVVEMTEVEIVSVSVDDSASTPEHVPTDLMGDRAPGSGDRAIDAFRPDPTAPVPPEMRDSLRPATGPAPGFAAARGTFASGLSQTDGSK